MKAPGLVLKLQGRFGRKNGPGLFVGAGACQVSKNRELKNMEYKCEGI